MINLHLLRTNFDAIARLLAKKEPTFDLSALAERDQLVRELQGQVEALRADKKKLSKGGPADQAAREQSIAIGRQLKEKENALEEAQNQLNELWLRCPNIPQEEVPTGNKESNQVVRSWGEEPTFDFPIKNHLELNETNNWFDLEAGSRIAGSQFVFYPNTGAKIMYALTQMMMRNNEAHGYQVVMPPYLASEQALYNSGNLPKFAGDFYQLPEESLCLIPTAEVSMTSLHAGQILEGATLPRRYCAWTPCFRREAGGYGATERGLIRIHQFEKVELYALTRPEESDQELDRMVACAESLLQKLELSYQVSLLAGQDCSFSSSKTYDIEVWLPGQNKHYEVSSASNCTDFQARRAKVRFRDEAQEKPQLVNMLNASSLALPRLMVAIMEQGQQADGSIVLPTALQEMLDSLG